MRTFRPWQEGFTVEGEAKRIAYNEKRKKPRLKKKTPIQIEEECHMANAVIKRVKL